MSSSSGGTGISLVSLLQASQVTTCNHHVTGSEQVTGRATEVQTVAENDVDMAEVHENDAEVGNDRNAVNGGVKKKCSFKFSKTVNLSLSHSIQCEKSTCV